MTASRISSARPSPVSIDRAPTSIHHQDIAATASVFPDEKNGSGVRIVVTKDAARVASEVSPAAPATREGAKEGTQSWRFVSRFVSTPESGTLSACFVNSKASETRVKEASSKKRAWTRVRAAAGHAFVSAGAAASVFRSPLRDTHPSSRFTKSASPRFEPATSCAKRRVFLGITTNEP